MVLGKTLTINTKGFSDIRASLMGPSIVVPVVDGNLLLGTWQQIIVVDHDNRPRSRKVRVQIIGV